MWASNLRFLNDSRELEYGLDMIRRVLKGNDNPTVKDVLDPGLVDPNEDAAYSVYGLSFSAAVDDLSQWRAYGSGGGYAIGFPCEWGSSKTLQRFAHENGCILGKVRYEQEEHRKLAQLLVGEMRTSHRPFDRMSESTAVGRETGPIIASLIKDPSFVKEEEWRLIGPHARPDEIRYRDGRTGITPYIALDLDEGVRDEIFVTVGPCPDKELARRAAAIVLGRGNLSSAIDRVSVSEIPYRDWG
jgi:hypothetical protein